MIISHSHKFIFLHNPKAGGSSLRKALLPYSEVGDRYRYMGRVNGEFYQMSHLPGDLALKVLEADHGTKIRDYKLVMLVRDPLNRFYSAAGQFVSGAYKGWFEKFNMPIKEFLLHVLTPEILRVHNFSLFQTQRSFWCSQYPEQVASRIDYIIPLETMVYFSEDSYSWVGLSRLLGIDPIELPRENTREKIATLDCEEIHSRVAELYESDYAWLSRVIPPYIIEYKSPLETKPQMDSYLMGARTIKRWQLGELPDLTLDLSRLSTDLVDAFKTSPLDFKV